jgi:pimeloyl-ACP methyl ester carboxylesterase
LHYFIASDGARIAYEDEGGGRPLLLLHGLMAHHDFFALQRPLADRFRLIRPDLRGHGESRAQTGLDVERLADDMAGLADALGLEDAIVVGWSLGASVLWHLLTGPASARFAGAVVVDMTPRVQNDAEWTLGLTPEACDARRQAIESDFASFAAQAGQAIFAEEGHHHSARWAGAEFARNDAAAIGALWCSLMQQDFRPLLGGIRQPTLIVHGARSHLYTRETAEHLAAAIPNSTLITFDQSGHSPHLEQPDLFNRTLTDFAGHLPPVRDRQSAI